MELWECALWGLFGGFAVEGLELGAAMRRTGRWPWNKRIKAGPVLASVVIRLGIGSGLAAAVGASGPVSVLSAVSVGVAAPLIIEKIAQQIPAGPVAGEPAAPLPPTATRTAVPAAPQRAPHPTANAGVPDAS